MKCTIEIAGREPVSFECAPEDTVLDAAAKAGWELPYSCRRGICDTCRARVVEGEVTPPARDGSALLCQVRACSDIRIAPARAERVQPTARKRIKAKLYRQRMAAPDVAIVDLRFPAGIKARFKAGQYLQVLLDGHQPRSFSMANAPKASDSAQLHIRVLPGGHFSANVLPQLKAGDVVEVELPFGDFYLREGSSPVLLLAGGTGFAPIQSLLEDALPRQPARQFTLYWGAREQQGLYALEQVAKWQQKYANFKFVGVTGGFAHESVLADYDTLEGHQAYVCGAPAMVSAARETFVSQKGLAPADFFSDAFATTVE